MKSIILIISAFWIIYFVGMISISLAYGQFQSEIMEPNKTATEQDDEPQMTEEEKITKREKFYAEHPELERPENLSSTYINEQKC